MYKLIHEIVLICDINIGIGDKCVNYERYDSCDKEHIIFCPTRYVERDLADLAYYNDRPIIIDGHSDNEKYYTTMLREVANISSKRRPLAIKDRFNFLPIFICPEIKSSFRNVTSMDLTEVTINKEYIEIFDYYKSVLASWVLELVTNFKTYLFPEEADDKFPYPSAEKHPFANKIDAGRERIFRKNNIAKNSAANVSILSLFFRGYMRVFKKLIPLKCNFEDLKGKREFDTQKTVEMSLIPKAEKCLIEFSELYTPTSTESLQVNRKDSHLTTKNIETEARKLATDIIKYYRSYGILIDINGEINIKGSVFIFNVKLLPGTRQNLISQNAGNVQTLLGYEYFKVDLKESPIKIYVSRQLSKTNSLIEMLESDLFQKNKMEIPYAVGYNNIGDMYFADIATFPHLLIGGSSGAGKSTAIYKYINEHSL